MTIDLRLEFELDGVWTDLPEMPLPVTVDGEPVTVEGEPLTVPAGERLWAQTLTPRRGRSPESSIVAPGQMVVELQNDDGALTDLALGTAVRLSVRGPEFSPWIIGGEVVVIDDVPVEIVAEEWRPRMTGEIVEVEPLWPAGNGDHADVSVTVAGLQRRLGQESQMLVAPLEGMATTGIAGWWPLTDSPGAVFAARVGEDASASVPSGWREGSVGAGSDPVLRIGPDFDGSFSGALEMAIADEWTVSFVYAAADLVPDGPYWYSRFSLLDLVTDGGVWSVEVLPSHPTLGQGRQLQLRRPGDDPEVPPVVSVRLDHFRGQGESGPLLVEAGLADGVSWLRVSDLDHRQWLTSSAATSAAVLQGLSAHWVTSTEDADTTTVSHVDIGQVIVSGVAVPDLRDAAASWMWERAGRRIERLCGQADLGFEALGDLDLTAPMGAQAPGKLTDALIEAANTDGGLLDESRDVLGWRYSTAEVLSSTPAAFDAMIGDVVPADSSPVPIRDDLRWTTDMTVTSGDLSASASAVATVVPRMARALEVSTPSVVWLQHLADRLLAAGQEPWRWPSVTLDVTLRPGDTAALAMWLDTNIGDRVRLGSMPSQSPVETLDIVVEEISENLTDDRWVVAVSGAPSAPWLVPPPVVDVPEWAVAVPQTVAPNDVSWILTPPPLATNRAQANRVQGATSLDFDPDRAIPDGLAVVFTARESDHASGPSTPAGWTLVASQAQSGAGGARCFVREVTDDLPASVTFADFGSGYRAIWGMVLEPIGHLDLEVGDSWGWAVSSGQVTGTEVVPTMAAPPARPDYAWARSYVLACGDGAAGRATIDGPDDWSLSWHERAESSTWRETGGCLFGGLVAYGSDYGRGYPPGVGPDSPTLTMPTSRDWAWIHLLVWRELAP